MVPIILRRRKLGKGSCAGIVAASTTGITQIRNWVEEDWPDDEYSFVFRWGCASSMVQKNTYLEIVNLASSIHWCSNKRESRLEMQEKGVNVPKTWGSYDSWTRQDGRVPVILRKSEHSQGRDLFMGGCWGDVRNKIHEWGHTQSYYISAYIPKIAEYRVACIQNRVAWVAQKTPMDPNAIAWNVAQGGRFDNVRWGQWPMRVVIEALKAARCSGTDFCGVDVMVDREGIPYVLEVNSAPSQTSPYRQKCFAECFDWIVNKGKEHFETIENPRNWRSIIHPAVVEE